MGLNQPTQDLRRELKDIAFLLEWTGVDLMQLAVRLSDAGLEAEALELAKKLAAFNDAEDKLTGYADEAKAGRIVRRKAE